MTGLQANAHPPAPISLSQEILTSVKVISSYLSANGYSQPSFSSNAPAAFPSAPEEIIVARRKLSEAAKTLYTLATYPREYLHSDDTFEVAIYPIYSNLHD